MERRTGNGLGTADEGEPAAKAAPPWWLYAGEFPRWYVWRGVTGLYYARIPGISPQRVLRAPTPDLLRDEILRCGAARRKAALSGLCALWNQVRIIVAILAFGWDHYSYDEASP
jgi:hypothetical protein